MFEASQGGDDGGVDSHRWTKSTVVIKHQTISSLINLFNRPYLKQKFLIGLNFI